jgi:hypothetical protein
MTSTYFNGYANVLFFINSGILWLYVPTVTGLKLARTYIDYLPFSTPLFFYILNIPYFLI